MFHSDPALTGNVYCNRRLDVLMKDAIAPFGRELRALSPESCLTLFRYGKGGEHLKVWIYGPEALSEAARPLLERCCGAFLASPRAERLPGDSWISKSGLPAIDDLDEAAGDHPDRTLAFSRYRRSAVLLGAEIFAADDRHVRLFAATQAAVSHLLLERLAPQADSPDYFKARQALFLNLLIAAFSALRFAPAELAEYLAYHRDWMIRTVAKIAGPGKTPATIVADFEQRAAAQRGAVSGLAAHLEAAGNGELLDQDPLLLEWRDAVGRFFAHAAGYRGDAAYDQDPFTADFAFLPLFKALHGAGNQFGFRVSHEGFLHHLLLAACREQPAAPFGAEAAAPGAASIHLSAGPA